jgi:1,4-alpha-glucan branching enzyme
MPEIAGRVDRDSPMGANLAPDGAGFRTWAPNARAVAVIVGSTALAAAQSPDWQGPSADDALDALGDGSWGGFRSGVKDGDAYLFFVAGAGSSGWKRDPFARELSLDPPYPNSFCIVRDAAAYSWRDSGWRPPAFSDLVIYQLHVGVWWAEDQAGNDVRATRGGTFLDVVSRLDYLTGLGVNAIQLLPIQEFETSNSLGYNGSDLFSPEMSYCAPPDEIDWRLAEVNAAFARFGEPPLTKATLEPGVNQLKAMVDLCHLHGVAVILDVVFNHAGGGGPVWGLDDRSLWFYDRQSNGDKNNSLYFTDQIWTGPVFAYWNAWVSEFLIDNACFYLKECHVDGFRYDEVSAVVNHGGAQFCKDMTQTVRAANPAAIQIAEYWNDDRTNAVAAPPDGLGFDAEFADGLRNSLRALLRQASNGLSASLDLGGVAAGLTASVGDDWRLDQCLENHDLTWAGHPDSARVAALADPAAPGSWYARSRSRAATTLLLTAPGIPSLFMGEEILEDKNWNDNRAAGGLIGWESLAGADPTKRDFLRFCSDLIGLRRSQPALRSAGVRVSRAQNFERVLVMHRWIESVGQDVVVVVSFDELPKRGYGIGLPFAGAWREIFNSDVYDAFPNPAPVGNGGIVEASGPPLDGFAASALMILPPNGALVLARA